MLGSNFNPFRVERFESYLTNLRFFYLIEGFLLFILLLFITGIILSFFFDSSCIFLFVNLIFFPSVYFILVFPSFHSLSFKLSFLFFFKIRQSTRRQLITVTRFNLPRISQTGYLATIQHSNKPNSLTEKFSSSYIYIYTPVDADKSESIPPLAFLINLGNIKCLKLNCACTKQKMERGRLPSLSPYDNETTRFIIPISTNQWIVSRLESFKLSTSFPASYPYHAIEIISHPSFQRIRRRKKGNDSFWDGGFRITFPFFLSLVVFFFVPSSAFLRRSDAAAF